MTKQEQIEEIVHIICGQYKDGICVIDKDNCDKSCSWTRWARDAEAIYNAGYRKISDKCVVITKDDLNLYKKQAVKEFAEKLKEICVRKRQFIDIDDKEEYYFDGAVTIDEIDELLKEYEVAE